MLPLEERRRLCCHRARKMVKRKFLNGGGDDSLAGARNETCVSKNGDALESGEVHEGRIDRSAWDGRLARKSAPRTPPPPGELVTGAPIKCRHERARAGNCLISWVRTPIRQPDVTLVARTPSLLMSSVEKKTRTPCGPGFVNRMRRDTTVPRDCAISFHERKKNLSV